MEPVSKPEKSQYRKWTTGQLMALERYVCEGMRLDEIAATMGRTKGAIAVRLHKSGMHTSRGKLVLDRRQAQAIMELRSQRCSWR